MRKFYSILALCCAAALFAGCEKEQDNLEVVDGLPASLDIVIDLGRSRDVVMTKGIYDYESEINELMLIMFSEKGRKMVLKFGASDLKDVSTSSPTLGGQRLYELAAPVTQDYYGQPVLSGTYEVYAVANWSSPFCGLEENDLVAMDKDALAAAFASNASFATGVTGSQKFPMTGYVAGQKVVPAAEVSETNKTSIKVVLTRLISHIEFNFVNGQSQVAGVNENPQFIPHSYSVYNLPKNAFMMSRKTDIAPEGNIFDGNEYGNVKDIEVTGSGGIELFMLENVQAAGTSTTYEARDVWTGTQGAAPENKTWTNAPANSTFIVVKGEYTGASYIGNVEYTIHLGNFSAKTEESYKNFTVNRNEYQKYKVTVNGVSKIVAEVTGTEQQPGAEGVITAVSNQTNLVLDSHYESCLLTFSLSGCLNPTIIVKSPYNAMNRYEVLDANGAIKALDGVDYGWVKFGKPASTTSLNAYPANGTGLVDIRQLALELKTAENGGLSGTEHFLISDGKVYVQAYVDEYYYSKRPDNGEDASWPEFVNAENRVLILNPTSQTSADGNSTLYPTYLFQISQRSIRTTYNTDDALIEAFGIETWNETGRSDFGRAASTEGLDDSFGWNNNKILLGVGNADSWPADAKTLGYTTSVTSNAKEAHVWFSEGTGVLEGYYACLSRNRDENGNGRVDAEELKWYLPAINQYLLLWCGENYLYGDTRLVDPADIPGITSSDYNNGVHNLFTSSLSPQYWAVEGVSYGEGGKSNGVRCIRNLNTYDSRTKSLSSVNGYVISVDGVRTLREQAMSGEYPPHKDRDPENRLFSSFQVAKDTLAIPEALRPVTAEVIRNNDLCASYSESDNDAGLWRIPNQKELMLMSQNNFLEDIKGTNNLAYASRTWFVSYNESGIGDYRKNPYWYFYSGENRVISIASSNSRLSFRIRCVRDITQ